MKFTAKQIDQMENDLSKAVSAARHFANQDVSMRLSHLSGLMAEVRHFAHCIQYGGSTAEAQARWLALFGGEE